MNALKLHSKYGPGGRNCPCCGPAPTERRRHDRTVRRRERREAMKVALKDAGGY